MMSFRKKVGELPFLKRYLIIFSGLIIGLMLQLSVMVILAQPDSTGPWRENPVIIISVLLSMGSLALYFGWALYETADPHASRMALGFKWLGLAILLFSSSWFLRDFQKPLADIIMTTGFWCGAYGLIDVGLSTRIYQHRATVSRPDYFKKKKDGEKEEE
ncbi:MAG: hypothetical protein ACXAEI_15540 [Candidatus Hodarchaeales archaeon]|jgi:hypothetical protein